MRQSIDEAALDALGHEVGVAALQGLKGAQVLEPYLGEAPLAFLHAMAADLWRRKIQPHSQRLAELRSMPYQEYLRTPEWFVRRFTALCLAERRCQLCNGGRDLHVHHRTYERRGEERIGDLTVLCAPCHRRHHGIHEEER